MMNGGMGSMMAWMMGFGLLGWVLVIALLVTILIVLVRLMNRPPHADGETRKGDQHSKPMQ